MSLILVLFALLCITSTALPEEPVATERAVRPNFLLIIADDLTWTDLGCTGSPDVKTPNIDRLAREGMTLSGMFTPAPMCSPCRHALYTGLYPVRSGAYPNHTMVDAGTKSMFTYFNELGYRTALQAKSHVNPKSSFPYQHLQPADNFPAFREFITADKSQPWLLVFASHDPHGPWNRGPKRKYDPAKLTVPSYLHDNEFTRGQLADYFAEISKLDNQVGECLKAIDETGQRDNTIVMFVSEQGSSFPCGGKWSLYDTGIRIATFVRWPGKIEPGSKSDALVQYVDVPPTFLAAAGADPATIDTGCPERGTGLKPVLPDADGKRGFDGRSFLNVLTGETDGHREYVFAQHTTVGIIGYREPYPIRAVRDARYKLIRNLAPDNAYWIRGIHGSATLKSWQTDAEADKSLAARIEFLSHRPGEELYDLESDPLETNNLAADPKFADIKTRLQKELDAWMTQQGDEGMETEIKALERQPKNQKK